MKNTDGANCIMAGAACADITPAAGLHLSGDIGRHRPAESALDRTQVKAVVLQSDTHRLCIISLDVTIICKDYTEQIRDRVCALGFERHAIMVHATQTHSAPGVGRFMLDPDFPGISPEDEWIGGGQPEYGDMVASRTFEAVREAMDRLEPVRVGAASGIEGRLAFNRRAVREDGSVGMPGPHWEEPLGPTWIKYMEGPIDPELGVLCLQNSHLKMIALLPHYTCHPVHVFGKGRLVSADWPGSLGAYLQHTHGADCVPLVINGCCGNINPWDPFDPAYPNDHLRMGKMLADTANRVIESVKFDEAPVLDFAHTQIPLQIKDVPEDAAKWADEVLGKTSGPAWTGESRTQVEWDWMRAAGIRSVELIKRREGVLMYEVQVFRIGSVAIVGLPGEPFVEGQLAIKQESKARLTYVAHCCTQYVGYLPTADAYPRGGHEVDLTYWAKLSPGCLEQITKTAANLISQLF